MKSYQLAASVSVSALCLVLGACAGDGDMGEPTPAPTTSPTPSPTPTPTPTPTGTPTPAPTPTSPPYLTMAQVNATGGDKFFDTAGVKWQALGPAAGASAFGTGAQMAFEYLATGDKYKVSRAAPIPSPTPSPLPSPISVEFPAGSGTTTGQVTTFTNTAGSVTDTLKLIVPQQGSVDLTYTRFLGFDHDDTGTANDLHYRTVYGVLTVLSDKPTTGTASYFTTILGTATRGATNYLLDGTSSGTFVVNFGASGTQITTSLDLKGKETSVSPVTSFATVSGTGTITGVSFTGNLTGGTGTSGQFGGAFFGPYAAEYGYAWYFNGTDFVADGYASGKKSP